MNSIYVNNPSKQLMAANYSSISSYDSYKNGNQSEFSFNKTSVSQRRQFQNNYDQIKSTANLGYKDNKYQQQIQKNTTSRCLSLREDLQYLSKEDIIQLLLEEIRDNKVLQKQINMQQNQLKAINTLRQNQQSIDYGNNAFQSQWEQKYKQLAMYMEEYITNTNEAQQQFISIISDLKTENNTLKQKLKKQSPHIKIKCSKPTPEKQHYQAIINDLEKTVEHYMKINNEGTCKYEKLKIIYEKMSQEMETANENINVLANQLKEQLSKNVSSTTSNISSANQSNSRTMRRRLSKSIDKEQTDRQIPVCQVSQFQQKENVCKLSSSKKTQSDNEKIWLLQIQNHELKQCNQKMQAQLSSKSQKIRKLLLETQKLSEEKWKYKEMCLSANSSSQISNGIVY